MPAREAARSAVRRISWLIGSAGRLLKNKNSPEVVGEKVVDLLEAMQHALEDWRDLAPREVREVEEKLRAAESPATGPPEE